VSANFAHHVIVCHEISLHKLVKSRKVRTAITVVMNVPDERTFKPCLKQCSRLKNETFILTHHGTITKNFGIQTIIDAVSLLKDRINIRLMIFGKGEYQKALEDLVRERGVEREVSFMGFVTQQELLQGICEADAGVVALLNEYQSPNKLFELVALKKPALSSDLQTIRQHFNKDCLEYFRAGDCIDLSDSILELYHSQSKRASLVANASKAYEKYKWTNMKANYLNVYKGLLNSEKTVCK